MVTVKASVDAAEKLGVRFRAEKDLQNKQNVQKNPNGDWGSFVLGTAQVSPLDMANAYATVAARGKRCTPTPLSKLLDRAGKPIPAPVQPRCTQAIPADIADAATDAARCPVGEPATSACSLRSGVTARSVGAFTNRPIAGKTGTTDDNNAAWFVGFTPNLAAAAFVANPDRPSESVPNTKIPIDVFKATMGAALKLAPAKDFVKPTSLRAWGIRVRVPDVDGNSVSRATSRLTSVGFKVRVSQERVPSRYSEGLVARTDPGGGESASKGGIITIFVSNGKKPADPKPSATPKPGGTLPFPLPTRRPRGATETPTIILPPPPD
jgi:membrane peptidoglycan carboxypeptidase